MSYRIRFLDTGEWVEAYDPDGGPQEVAYPTGEVKATGVPARALVFPTAAAAWDLWRKPSMRTPLRPDGKPNRPLSAYTVIVERVPNADRAGR